jgi:hypothetical protein
MDDPFINEEAKNIIKEQILIDASIDNLIDLINLCDKYPLADNVEYNINMKSLHNIKPSLLELQNMIGMQSIKENIVDQIYILFKIYIIFHQIILITCMRLFMVHQVLVKQK